MGMYLGISKISETETTVRYQFNSGIIDCIDIGVIEIDKLTGDCYIIQSMPGDKEDKLAFYAGRALVSHWKKKEFPDKTCWAC